MAEQCRSAFKRLCWSQRRSNSHVVRVTPSDSAFLSSHTFNHHNIYFHEITTTGSFGIFRQHAILKNKPRFFSTSQHAYIKPSSSEQFSKHIEWRWEQYLGFERTKAHQTRMTKHCGRDFLHLGGVHSKHSRQQFAQGTARHGAWRKPQLDVLSVH